MSKHLIAIIAATLLTHSALAADDDPCKRFTWNVAHELDVMKQSAQPIAAGAKSASDAPTLQLDKAYEVKLVDQGSVAFAATPGRPTLPDGTQGGLVRFTTEAAGAYRISMTSGHWIDVVEGVAIIKSRDFQGARGCERPRKIVEYDLPARKTLVLQLSGASDTPVTLAVTTVSAPKG